MTARSTIEGNARMLTRTHTMYTHSYTGVHRAYYYPMLIRFPFFTCSCPSSTTRWYFSLGMADDKTNLRTNAKNLHEENYPIFFVGKTPQCRDYPPSSQTEIKPAMPPFPPLLFLRLSWTALLSRCFDRFSILQHCSLQVHRRYEGSRSGTNCCG